MSNFSCKQARFAFAALAAAFALGFSHDAQAQSTIKSEGDHPPDAFELEPHLLFSPFDAPDFPSNGGYGIGARATFEIAPDGFIPRINDSVGIGVGLDWMHYDGVSGRAFCNREVNVDGVGVCVETTAHGGSNYLFVPIVMQWNFWLHRRWSVFGEPGLAVTHWSEGGFGVEPVFSAGGRFHISDNIALTARLGYPAFSLGVSFMF